MTVSITNNIHRKYSIRKELLVCDNHDRDDSNGNILAFDSLIYEICTFRFPTPGSFTRRSERAPSPTLHCIRTYSTLYVEDVDVRVRNFKTARVCYNDSQLNGDCSAVRRWTSHRLSNKLSVKSVTWSANILNWCFLLSVYRSYLSYLCRVPYCTSHIRAPFRLDLPTVYV